MIIDTATEWQNLKDKPNGEKVGWKIQKTRYLYQSVWHSLRQDMVIFPDGVEHKFTYMDHPGAVFIIPYTVDKKFILIRTYRYTVDDWVWEVPAGGLGDKKGTPMLEVARQELEEETGGVCTHLEDLGWFYAADGVAKKKIHYILAHGVTLSKDTRHEPGETIDTIQAFTEAEVMQKIAEGSLRDGESAFAFFLAQQALRKS